MENNRLLSLPTAQSIRMQDGKNEAGTRTSPIEIEREGEGDNKRPFEHTQSETETSSVQRQQEVTTSSGQEAEQLAKRQKLDVAPAASEATGTSDQAQTVATGEGDVRVHSGTDAEGEILSQTTQLAEEDDEEDEDSVDYEEESDEEESEEDVDDLSDIAACLNRPPSPPSEPLGRRAPTSKKYEGLFMNGLSKLMFGFGDYETPLPECIKIVNDAVTEYLQGLISDTLLASRGRDRLLSEDILYVVRNDKKKYERCLELLFKGEMTAQVAAAAKKDDKD